MDARATNENVRATWNVSQCNLSRYVDFTFELSSHHSELWRCRVADHTCKNMPMIILIVAVVRNITGICQVNTCSRLGTRRPDFLECFRSPFVFDNSLRMPLRPSRCPESRCSRTVWSAAVKMLNSDRIMPQYHAVLIGQGDSRPLGSTWGQLPVEVSTPANKAATTPMKFNSLSLLSLHWIVKSSFSFASSVLSKISIGS